jgi:hypothetical protein
MKKVIVAILVLGLMPITTTVSEARVCTYKRYQIKDSSTKSYTYYRYVTKRVCR